jgi:hypothetical protein
MTLSNTAETVRLRLTLSRKVVPPGAFGAAWGASPRPIHGAAEDAARDASHGAADSPHGAPDGASGGAAKVPQHRIGHGTERGTVRGAPAGEERGAPIPRGTGRGGMRGATAEALRDPRAGADEAASPRVAAIPRCGGASVAGEVDAQTVIYRLEEAGRTLLSLPPTGYSTKLRTSSIDLLRSALEGSEDVPAFASGHTRLHPPVPSAARITRMDEAFGWVVLIPRDRYVIRRIVGCRALVGPITERHLFSWRRIGTLLGADHKAIQRWHAQGIDMIVAAVNAMR